MFRHVVLFRWTPDTTAEHVERITTGLRALPAQIPEMGTYRCGSDLGISDGAFDFAVVADFADQASWLTYRDHPLHQQVIADHIAPHIAERAALQYEIDPT